MVSRAAEASGCDVQILCSSLVQFDFDRRGVSVCPGLFVFCFLGYWIFGQDNARKDFCPSGMNPMTDPRNCNCQQDKTLAQCTAVQVKQVLLTELLMTAESVTTKGIFACLHVMPCVGHKAVGILKSF